MENKNWNINELEDLIRIDKFVVENTELSRSHVQKLLEDGNILVNDIKVKANYKLKLNDNVF